MDTCTLQYYLLNSRTCTASKAREHCGSKMKYDHVIMVTEDDCRINFETINLDLLIRGTDDTPCFIVAIIIKDRCIPLQKDLSYIIKSEMYRKTWKGEMTKKKTG